MYARKNIDSLKRFYDGLNIKYRKGTEKFAITCVLYTSKSQIDRKRTFHFSVNRKPFNLQEIPVLFS